MLGISSAAVPPVFSVALVVVLYRRRVNWPYLAFGLCLGAVLLMPGAYRLNITRLDDLQRVLGGVWRRTTDADLHLAALQSAVSGVAGGGLEGLARPTESVYVQKPFLSTGYPIGAIAFVLAIPYVALRTCRSWAQWRADQDSAKYGVIAVWLIVPLFVVFGDTSLTVEASAVVLPAACVAIGILADRACQGFERVSAKARWWAPVGRVIVAALVLCVVGFQAGRVVALYHHVEGKDVSAEYGLPYRYWRRTVRLVKREAEKAPTDQVWVYTEGHDPEVDPMPAGLEYLLGPTIRPVFFGNDDTEAMLLPAERPGLYLLTQDSPRVRATIRQLSGDRLGIVPMPDAITEATLYGAKARSADEMLELIDHRGIWLLDSGLVLVGYDLPEEMPTGSRATIATYWTFLEIPQDDRGAPHSLRALLVGEDGTQAAQCQGFGLPSTEWQAGLLMKQWCDMYLANEMSPSSYLVLAMDRQSDGYRNQYIDDRGYPLADAIQLGPFPTG